MDAPFSDVASARGGLPLTTLPPIQVVLQVAPLVHLVANLREGEEAEEAIEMVVEVVVESRTLPMPTLC